LIKNNGRQPTLDHGAARISSPNLQITGKYQANFYNFIGLIPDKNDNVETYNSYANA